MLTVTIHTFRHVLSILQSTVQLMEFLPALPTSKFVTVLPTLLSVTVTINASLLVQLICANPSLSYPALIHCSQLFAPMANVDKLQMTAQPNQFAHLNSHCVLIKHVPLPQPEDVITLPSPHVQVISHSFVKINLVLILQMSVLLHYLVLRQDN